jgi:N4-(beta-N-acetylglucosaminyl)-L-asparaginase
MYNRRNFIKLTAAGASASLVANNLLAQNKSNDLQSGLPIVISTWNFGIPANQEAWKILSNGGRALDAVEAGVKIPEADLTNHTVGRAGYPDRDGRVTLDACIMDDNGNCGAVAAMEYIAHPISICYRTRFQKRKITNCRIRKRMEEVAG